MADKEQQLWAPWRLAYITAPKAEPTEDPCFICRAKKADNDRENHLVRRKEHVLVILNRYPYNNGHLLVAPTAHKATLQELTDEELLASMHDLQLLTTVLDDLMHPDGYNIGLNLGAAAGAGLPGHLHWHIVPRWNGDNNFMPVLGNTRVLSQSLDSLYELLTEKLKEHG